MGLSEFIMRPERPEGKSGGGQGQRIEQWGHLAPLRAQGGRQRQGPHPGEAGNLVRRDGPRPPTISRRNGPPGSTTSSNGDSTTCRAGWRGCCGSRSDWRSSIPATRPGPGRRIVPWSPVLRQRSVPPAPPLPSRCCARGRAHTSAGARGSVAPRAGGSRRCDQR